MSARWTDLNGRELATAIDTAILRAKRNRETVLRVELHPDALRAILRDCRSPEAGPLPDGAKVQVFGYPVVELATMRTPWHVVHT